MGDGTSPSAGGRTLSEWSDDGSGGPLIFISPSDRWHYRRSGLLRRSRLIVHVLEDMNTSYQKDDRENLSLIIL